MIDAIVAEHLLYLVLIIGIVQAIAAIGLICISIVAIIVLILKCAIVLWKRIAGKESARGKAVLITGCDTGFGYDLTKLLDEQGCTVFAGCLNADKNGAQDLMTSCSKRVHVIQMDISKDDDVANALRYVSKHCSQSGLWAIVNNAGFNVMGDVEFLGPKLYLKAMDVNFYGAVRVTRAFLYLVRKSQGRVINISSGRGRFSWPRDSAYHVTKYCLETYSDSLRLEMKKFGVKVSVIEPGHFGGITACQDAVQFARYERERDEMWNNAADEMKGTYGEYYLQSLLDAQSKGLKSSATTTKPVMDAILDAMFNYKPDIRYLVSGSNGWFDKSTPRSLGKTLFFWNTFLICHTPVLLLDSEDQNNVLELKIPWVRIPKVETYYVCQQFQVPSDKAYHVTQFDVIINNTAMVHHLLLFGCNFEMDEKGPHPCDSIDNHCHTWLTKWDVGMETSDKMPPDAGVRFGKGSFKHVLLQIHWNNKYLLDNETDESGIRLTYTDKLRKYNIGHVQIGQNKIEIPANTEEVSVTGKCSSKCTGLMLPRSIYLSRAYLHMHQLGISTTLDVQRDREVVHRLASEFNYNYTSPIVHTFSPAINVDPGDEIRLTCRYNSAYGSRHRNTTISFGQGTNGEMCYAFIMYYPRVVGFDQCIQDGDKNVNCDAHTHV